MANINVAFQNAAVSAGFIPFWVFVSTAMLIAASLLFLFYYVCIDRRKGYALFLSLMLSLLTVEILKALVCEPRPFVFDARLVNFDPKLSFGWSFPSGHSSSVASVCGCLYCLYGGRKNRPLAACVSVCMLLIAAARMTLGVHFLHDCTAGLVIGFAAGYFSADLCVKKDGLPAKYTAVISCFLVVSGIAAAIAGMSGISFFSGNALCFYILVFIGSFVLGDTAERRYIGLIYQKSTAFAMVRLLTLLLSAAVIAGLYIRFIALNQLTFSILITAASFFITAGHSALCRCIKV